MHGLIAIKMNGLDVYLSPWRERTETDHEGEKSHRIGTV